MLFRVAGKDSTGSRWTLMSIEYDVRIMDVNEKARIDYGTRSLGIPFAYCDSFSQESSSISSLSEDRGIDVDDSTTNSFHNPFFVTKSLSVNKYSFSLSIILNFRHDLATTAPFSDSSTTTAPTQKKYSSISSLRLKSNKEVKRNSSLSQLISSAHSYHQ